MGSRRVPIEALAWRIGGGDGGSGFMVRYLLCLAALDLCVDLVGARVEQVDGLILELPHIAIEAKVIGAFINALTWD